jgi:hypothetical protein
MTCTKLNSNCFEKTESGGAFFIFHQITDELKSKLLHRLCITIYKHNKHNS